MILLPFRLVWWSLSYAAKTVLHIVGTLLVLGVIGIVVIGLATWFNSM